MSTYDSDFILNLQSKILPITSHNDVKGHSTSAPSILHDYTQSSFQDYTSEDHSVPTHNSCWNKDMEHTINTVIKKSKKYHDMHLQLALKYSNRYFYTTLFLIILSPLSTTLTIMGILQIPYPLIVNCTSAMSSFLSGVLASLLKFGKYDQVSSDHKLAASRYITLANSAITQLSLSSHDRVNGLKFLKWITSAYDELYEASPLIPVDFIDHEGIEEDLKIIIEKEQTYSKSLRNIDKEKKQLSSIFPVENQTDIYKYSDIFLKYQMDRLEK